MRIYYPDAEETKLVAQWVQSKIRGCGDLTPCTAICVMKDDRVFAAAVYNGYRHPDIQINFAAASPRWATRNTVAAFLSYPFSIGCSRITAIVHPKNKRIRKLLEGVGFVHEGTMRDAFYPHNALLYGLTKRDFERGKYGQKSTVRAAAA